MEVDTSSTNINEKKQVVNVHMRRIGCHLGVGNVLTGRKTDQEKVGKLEYGRPCV